MLPAFKYSSSYSIKKKYEGSKYLGRTHHSHLYSIAKCHVCMWCMPSDTFPLKLLSTNWMCHFLDGIIIGTALKCVSEETSKIVVKFWKSQLTISRILSWILELRNHNTVTNIETASTNWMCHFLDGIIIGIALKCVSEESCQNCC